MRRLPNSCDAILTSFQPLLALNAIENEKGRGGEADL